MITLFVCFCNVRSRVMHIFVCYTSSELDYCGRHFHTLESTRLTDPPAPPHRTPLPPSPCHYSFPPPATSTPHYPPPLPPPPHPPSTLIPLSSSLPMRFFSLFNYWRRGGMLGGGDFNQRGVSDEKKGVVLIGDVWEGRGGWVSKETG